MKLRYQVGFEMVSTWPPNDLSIRAGWVNLNGFFSLRDGEPTYALRPASHPIQTLPCPGSDDVKISHVQENHSKDRRTFGYHTNTCSSRKCWSGKSALQVCVLEKNILTKSWTVLTHALCNCSPLPDKGMLSILQEQQQQDEENSAKWVLGP